MTKDLSIDTMVKLNDKQEKEIKFLEKKFRHLEFPYRDDVLSLIKY